MEGRLSGLSVTLLAASLSKVIFTSLSLSFLQGEKLHFKIESYSNSANVRLVTGQVAQSYDARKF